MKKICLLSILVVGFLLSACNNKPTAKAMSTGETSMTVTPYSSVTTTVVSPSPTLNSTATAESVFRLTELKEWDGYRPTAWFPDGGHFAMLSEDGVNIYSTSLELIWNRPSADPLLPNSGIAVSPDNKLVAVYNAYQGGITLLEALSGKFIAKSGQDHCSINIDAQRMLFRNNNTLLIGFQGESKKGNRPIRITSWNISPLQCAEAVITKPVSIDQPTNIDTMFTDSNDKYLVTVSNHYYHDSYQGYISVWSTERYDRVCEISGTYAAFRPTNGLLAVVDAGDKLSYWDVKTCKLVENIDIPEYKSEIGYTPQALVFTPDGKYLVMCRAGLQVLDANTGVLLVEKKLDIVGCSDFSISPDGKYVLAAYTGLTTLWQIDR